MERLWTHQAAAAEAACTALAGGGRATIVAACGTGKTRTAAEASRRLAPAGRVLVTIPEPGLLAPTAAEWARWLGPAAGPVITVPGTAGPAGDPATAGGGIAGPGRVITDPAALARLLAAGGRVTVLCAGAGLPVITAAHRDHGAPPWDLLIADDAHLPAAAGGGQTGAVIHRDELIPAARRLYLTATPQIINGKGGNLVGLDDQGVFGPVVHRLPFAEATRMGILAGYRVAVGVVTTAEATALAGARRFSTVQLAAVQLALARAITAWDLRQVITCHDQQPAADRFTAALARNLDRMDPADRPARPVTARPADPGPAAAGHRQDLAVPADPGGHTSVTATVLAGSADLRAPDAIAFTDPQISPAGVARAIGRALRRRPGASTTLTIIIPVLLPRTASTGQALEGSAFDTVRKVVRALRAHDEQLARWLDARRARQARADPASPEQAARWLHVLGPAATPALTRAVQAQMVTAATTSWPVHYAALREFHARHGHADLPIGYQAGGIDLRKWLDASCRALRAGTLAADRAQALAELGVTGSRRDAAWQRGLAAATAYHARHGDLRVPPGHRTSDGLALYTWLTNQRKPGRRGTLTPGQAHALDTLGFDWDPQSDRWDAALAALRAFRDTHGHADVPVRHITPGGLRLGNWLSTSRRGYHAGTLPAARVTALTDLGVTWDPAAATWQHHRQHLADYVTGHGNARVPLLFTAADGCPLGRWVSRQRQRHQHPGTPGRPALTSGQRTSLTQLGMIWDATSPNPHDSTPAPRPRQ